jgi:hypothetical protein
VCRTRAVGERDRILGRKREMMLLQVTRDLAQRLLAYEAAADASSAPTEAAILRVYEKLHRSLCTLAGVAGFQSLVSRALALTSSEAPSLSEVQVTADGHLQGISTFDPHGIGRQNREDGVILIAHLLGLLSTLVGDGLTLRLVQDAWPDAALDYGNSGIGRRP